VARLDVLLKAARDMGASDLHVLSEIMFVTQAVSVMIREKKTFQIMSAMQTGKREGMQLMEDSLLQLVREGKVTPEDAGVTPSGTVKKPIVLPSGMVA
jgi:twitching motility protein PilT